MKVHFYDPTPMDLVELAANMKEVDREEVYASCGLEPLEALQESVEVSDWCKVAIVNGVPEAIFGTCELYPGCGGAWMLSSDFVEHFPKTTWKVSKQVHQMMHERYPVLMNYVDARNVVTRRWLERLGFKNFHVNQSYGYKKMPFIQYVSSRNV